MNAKENKQNQIEKLRELLEQADKLAPESRAEYLLDHGADVRETAEWIRDESYTGNNKKIYHCSHCGHWQAVKKMQRDQIMYMNYCPFCGAKMIKKEEKEKLYLHQRQENRTARGQAQCASFRVGRRSNSSRRQENW